MAEVKRYDLEWRSCMGGYSGSNEMVESSDGEWLRYDDAITLERKCQELEREYAGLCDRYDNLTEALGAQCAESTRLERERDEYKSVADSMGRDAVEFSAKLADAQAELARLRAVEKAAKAMIEAGLADIDDAERAYDALAEACGRKP